MTETLYINRRLSIPISAIQFSAIRASGPGGQSVNKTSSAVHLQLDLADIEILEGHRERILAHSDRRISSNGIITIKAQNSRTQTRNRQDALDRLQTLLREALKVEAPRRATRPTWGSTKRRLKKKAERGAIKANRGKVRDFD
ncbi:alternative ribosome rescue aminoacyl-tRNA hydrolase ArfB [Litorimonas sp. RW-G-Af-16]|uniref:alternative ribosome rescue aminoacyl-tRNA hydrolase ArfB n=1 Tax=Litorimonas sp. RW-G-Af-16 TaxID=3241168 RepID=UPI00390CD800